VADGEDELGEVVRADQEAIEALGEGVGEDLQDTRDPGSL